LRVFEREAERKLADAPPDTASGRGADATAPL